MFAESDIVIKTRQYVEDLMGKNLSDDLSYHNLQHTQEVVKATLEIGENNELSDDQMEMAVLSAWLHDTGYLNGAENHEQESIDIAKEFLNGNSYAPEKLKVVLDAIEATRVPQHPKNLVGEVLCDADMYHLSNDQFKIKSKLLKKELEIRRDRPIEDEEWLGETLSFVKQHRYFTNYGKYVLEPRKAKNLKKLKKGKKKSKDNDKAKNDKSEKYVDKLENEVVKLKNRLDREREIRPTRGIETMFRTTSRNHLTLSGMADNKANIDPIMN